MGLSENEQEIWNQLETDLLLEPSINAAQKEIAKIESAPTRKLIIGVFLLLGGFIGLTAAVFSNNIWIGLVGFAIMIYGVNYAYEYLSQLAVGGNKPKNKGFSAAYDNLKNYKPRNNIWGD
jgi:predicted lipid-binding transport protein (Tim44 family)